LSLYRGLLKQCKRFPKAATSNGSTESTLQALVKFRFRKDSPIQSPTQIENGIAAAEDFSRLLESCNNRSHDALNRLGRILESIDIKAEQEAALRARNASFWQPPQPSRIKHMEHVRRVADKRNHETTPEHPRLFEHPRPLSEIKGGVRRVPNLVMTSGIPILKWPGRQPTAFTRVIKQKHLSSVKSFDQKLQVEQAVHMADTEDDWDACVQRDHEIREHGLTQASPPKWTAPLLEALREIDTKHHARGHRYAAMGKDLYRIVLEERELKEKERRAAKHERRMARKRAAAEDSGIQQDENSKE
jgi:hypothetical protein